MRKYLLTALMLTTATVARAQMNEELDECMRNPMSRWCHTMQQQDRDRFYEQQQQLNDGRRAQMCAINRAYCY